jgi:SOS-response transcriptional repressor LexA
MTKLAHGLSNGFNGARSLDNPSSLLAKLVFHVRTAHKQGVAPTRRTFMRAMGRKNPSYGEQIIRMALKNHIIKYTGEKDGRFRVLALGPHAEVVKTYQNLFETI